MSRKVNTLKQILNTAIGKTYGTRHTEGGEIIITASKEYATALAYVLSHIDEISKALDERDRYDELTDKLAAENARLKSGMCASAQAGEDGE